MIESSLILLKPDAVSRGLVGAIISRFEAVWLDIVAINKLTPTTEMVRKHYPTDRTERVQSLGKRSKDDYLSYGRDVAKDFGTNDEYEIGAQVCGRLVENLTSWPVVAIVVSWNAAIKLVRKIIGHTVPAEALPGSIRGDYSTDNAYMANTEKRPIRNLIHASGNAEEATFEIDLRFPTQHS